MAGYHGFSKSNNAVYAEENGCFPASTLARRLGVQVGAIKALMESSEWHHSSKYYNKVDYYDGAAMLAVLVGDMSEFDGEDIAEATKLLAALKAWKAPTKTERVWTDCTVNWIEWSGSRTRPKADKRSAEGCTVTHRGGAFVDVVLPTGKTFRKKLDANGFSFEVPGHFKGSDGLPVNRAEFMKRVEE